MGFDTLALLVLFGGAFFTMVVLWRVRARREARDALLFAQAKKENRHLPPTLHPVIDPDLCSGCLSCLKVCPEGDVLGVVEGKAVLINGTACIGHGKCALECPVDAIKLVFGTEERGMDLPELSDSFETTRPGIFIAGELGGMGLIKNAITQGLQCGAAIGEQLKGQARTKEDRVDVLIVGAGSAGISTALACKKAGLTFRLVEQESLGGTIAHYPRQKIVMSERVELPYFGKFGADLISKEQLLETWTAVCQKAGITVESDVKVSDIQGDNNLFTVKTSKGDMLSRKVVLAIGRRGTPRKLGVPGENLDKVAYRLIDAEQYDGTKVLVVGGGDSALEAAMQIANETKAEVVVSCRMPEFGPCREANKQKVHAMAAEGRLKLAMSSNVREVTENSVVLSRGEKQVRLQNDYVIACLGGELPTPWLQKMGIGLKRYHGEERGGSAKAARGSAVKGSTDAKQRRLSLILTIAGILITGTLFVAGADYYPLDKAARAAHPLHKFLKPSGTWGHGVGIVATFFMMSNFIYSLRKRWSRLKGRGPIRGWLTFHQFVGLVSPIAIVFHAAFQSNNQLATATAISVSVVVLTGIIGRFIFGLVPSEGGQTEGVGELKARWERVKQRFATIMKDVSNPAPVEKLVKTVVAPADSTALGAELLNIPSRTFSTAAMMRAVKPLFPNEERYKDFKETFNKAQQLRRQVSFYGQIKRTMSVWRQLHVVLAVVLVVMIAAHIGVSLYLGYAWIFSR